MINLVFEWMLNNWIFANPKSKRKMNKLSKFMISFSLLEKINNNIRSVNLEYFVFFFSLSLLKFTQTDVTVNDYKGLLFISTVLL